MHIHPIIKPLLLLLLLPLNTVFTYGQQLLTMKDALELGTKNYGTIQAKALLTQSQTQAVLQARRDYLPNVVFSAQQVYGTINGQNGPLYGFGGFGVASSGLPLPDQNWNAAFGSLYLVNVNWEVFTFGRAKGRIEVANTTLGIAQADLAQEQFQHHIRIAAAYLNTLGAQRLAIAQQKNLDRAQVFQRSVLASTKGGLVAGVDSSLANAEVANAKIALLRAQDFQQEEEKKLALLLGVNESTFLLDSAFVAKSPAGSLAPSISNTHPVLNFYQSRMNQSDAQLRLAHRNYFPSVTLTGVFQARASGFDAAYVQDQTAFSTSYTEGILPSRANYLLGIGLVWNATTLLRTRAQEESLHYVNLATQAEMGLAKQQLDTQVRIAEAKLANALQIRQEAPIQIRSASDAYVQKSALYRNGLTTLVDVTQTLYALNRAETDRDLAFINVWQALLLKAAATGDLLYFINESNN